MNVMNAVMRNYGGITQYRIIKDREGHITWYFATDTIPTTEKVNIEQCILQSHLAQAFEQDFVWQKHISPDENGKLRILVDKTKAQK